MKIPITINRAMDVALSQGFQSFPATVTLVKEVVDVANHTINGVVVARVPLEEYFLDIRPLPEEQDGSM